jgi:hypothetical protein
MTINQTASVHLMDYVGSTDYAVYACVISGEGEVLAEAAEPAGPPEEVKAARTVIHRFLGSYPRKDVSKVILDDDSFTTVVQRLTPANNLIVVARKDAPLGVITMNVAKLASKLE